MVSILIRCADPRLNSNKDLKRWIKENLKDFYLISLGGSSKSLADAFINKERSVLDSLLKNINIPFKSHKVDKIIIFHHSDCVAYNQDYKPDSLKTEKEKQIEDMRTAKKILAEKHPEVEIVLLWGKLKGPKGKEIAFEILNV